MFIIIISYQILEYTTFVLKVCLEKNLVSDINLVNKLHFPVNDDFRKSDTSVFLI